MTYKKGDVTIQISELPNRKRKCLLVGNDYVLTKVASFDDDEAAEMFEKAFEYFCNIKERAERC